MIIIVKTNPKKIEKGKLKQIINLLKKGGVVVFPTDTVYGLIADATNKNAVKKIFLIKKRVFKKPVPIFVKDIKMAKKLAKIDKKQEKLLKSVWPGKVTVVLKRNQGKSKIKLYGVDKKTIALRIPKFEALNFLLSKINKPLVGTSANLSRKPASGNPKKVFSQFKQRRYQPDLIIDAGVLPGKPSTLLDLTSFSPKILRK